MVVVVVAVVIWVLGFIWVIEFLFWDLFGFEFLLWFELAAVPMGGAIGLLGSDRWLRERKRETEEERQKLERGDKWERIEMVLGYMVLGYIILLYRYFILICCIGI